MSSVGLYKGQVSLATGENWLFEKKRDQSSGTVKNSTFNASRFKYCQNSAFILKTTTNLPSIMVHKRHVYRCCIVAFPP